MSSSRTGGVIGKTTRLEARGGEGMGGYGGPGGDLDPISDVTLQQVDYQAK